MALEKLNNMCLVPLKSVEKLKLKEIYLKSVTVGSASEQGWQDCLCLFYGLRALVVVLALTECAKEVVDGLGLS